MKKLSWFVIGLAASYFSIQQGLADPPQRGIDPRAIQRHADPFSGEGMSLLDYFAGRRPSDPRSLKQRQKWSSGSGRSDTKSVTSVGSDQSSQASASFKVIAVNRRDTEERKTISLSSLSEWKTHPDAQFVRYWLKEFELILRVNDPARSLCELLQSRLPVAEVRFPIRRGQNSEDRFEGELRALLSEYWVDYREYDTKNTRVFDLRSTTRSRRSRSWYQVLEGFQGCIDQKTLTRAQFHGRVFTLSSEPLWETLEYGLPVQPRREVAELQDNEGYY
jgi:hypothetical protein